MFLRFDFIRSLFLLSVFSLAFFLLGFTEKPKLSLTETVSSALRSRADFKINLKEIDRLSFGEKRSAAALFAPKIRFALHRQHTLSDSLMARTHVNQEVFESSYSRILSGGSDLTFGYEQSSGIFGTPDIAGPERYFVSYATPFKGKSEEFLRSEYGLDLARKEKLKSALTYGVAYQNLVFEVAQLYFLTFQALNGLDTEYALLAQRQKLLTAAQKKLNLGVGSRFDLLRAEVEMAGKKERVLAAENTAVNAWRRLINRAGLSTNFSVSQLPSLSGELNPAVLSFQGDYYTKKALENRPELKIALIDMEIIQAELAMVREVKKRRPMVSGYLEKNSAHSGFDPFAAHKGDYRLGLSYEIPIGDQERINEEAGLKLELEKRELFLQDLKERIILEVETVIANINSLTERLLQLENNWEQAKEAVRLAEYAYLKGAAGPLDLINTQDILSSTEFLIVQAATERKIAEFQLLRESALFPADTSEIDEYLLLKTEP